jgi:hypothetical protein
VIRSPHGGVRITADVEGNTWLASFINRVTAQHVEWIKQLRQDILAAADDWALSGRRS